MKSRIRRAKQFVTDHSHEIVGTSGFVLGAAVTFHLLAPRQTQEILQLTKDQAQNLINDPELCVEFVNPHGWRHVIVIPES